jgi:hypothetical protein
MNPMPSDEPRFISEEIAMLESAAGGEPVAFRFRNSLHRVTAILKQWQDYGFSSAAVKRDWRNRRHRNYYEVRTDQGTHLLLYFDRGVKASSPRVWVVLAEYGE